MIFVMRLWLTTAIRFDASLLTPNASRFKPTPHAVSLKKPLLGQPPLNHVRHLITVFIHHDHM